MVGPPQGKGVLVEGAARERYNWVQRNKSVRVRGSGEEDGVVGLLAAVSNYTHRAGRPCLWFCAK